ncbi:hypothetical protein [Bacillus nitratireducens]|uniref:hypothetical protein n=1 Tax=Bacillus nitratireducens TaxID=2026193 RepID=UPI002E231709|nr:hypothetical protein [Bacillus nitratireducens]
MKAQNVKRKTEESEGRMVMHSFINMLQDRDLMIWDMYSNHITCHKKVLVSV